MPDGISEKAKTDFLTWLSEAYGYDWSWLQLPEVLARFGNKNNQWYQYWAKYVYQPPKTTIKQPLPTGKEKLRPGAITDKQYYAWLEYQKAGGALGLYEW